MVSNGLSKHGHMRSAKSCRLAGIGSSPWLRTKRGDFLHRGVALRNENVAKSCSKLRNWPPPFGGHRSSHLNHRSPRRHASRYFKQVWPDRTLRALSELLSEFRISPALSIVLGVRAARQDIPATLALPAFLQSYVGNLVTAGVRLVPLGQTDGQLAVAELEPAVLAVTAQARQARLTIWGRSRFMVDLASASHETQYTRLFRS